MADSPKPANKNWLLIKFRDYHSWLGVFLAIFIVTICATGLYLNHKELFERKKEPGQTSAAPVKEGKGKKGPKAKEYDAGPALLRTTTDLEAAVAVSFQEALKRAEAVWGDADIEHVQLKKEHGRLVYKIKRHGEKELLVDAGGGAVEEKDGYSQLTHTPGEQPKEGYNWGKIIKDLHTGKIGELPGKLFVDFVAVVITFLTATGIYLWMVPKYRKWKKERAQAARKANGVSEPVAT